MAIDFKTYFTVARRKVLTLGYRTYSIIIVGLLSSPSLPSDLYPNAVKRVKLAYRLIANLVNMSTLDIQIDMPSTLNNANPMHYSYFQVQFLTELTLQVRYTISDADDEFFFDDASTFDGSGTESNLTDIELELEFDER